MQTKKRKSGQSRYAGLEKGLGKREEMEKFSQEQVEIKHFSSR